MTAKKPKISIITINYNNQVGLEQTITSVVQQSYREIEHLVIDGASTDGSLAIIEKNKDQLAYWVSERDRGIYHAMNKGIEASTGDYLLFLNSGDCLLEASTIEQAVKTGLSQDLVYGDLKLHTQEKEWFWNLPQALTFQTFYQSSIAHPSTFIKKELFELVGLYDENSKIVADWKFFLLAIARYNCSYQHINQVIANYNFDGISSKPENLAQLNAERKKVLETEFPSFIKDYEELAMLKKEHKRISYFLKTRKLIKKFLNQR